MHSNGKSFPFWFLMLFTCIWNFIGKKKMRMDFFHTSCKGPVTSSCIPTELFQHCKISGIAVISQENSEYLYNFYWNYDVRQRLKSFHGTQRHVTVFLWSSTWQLTAFSQSAHGMLRVFTSCLPCPQLLTVCTRHSCEAVTSQRTQTHSAFPIFYTAIRCVTWVCQLSSSGAAGDLTVLSWKPHFVSTAGLSECRA